MLTARAIARTPLHSWHTAHGAHFADRDSWQVVSHYASAEQEATAARAGLAVTDASAFAKISLTGRGIPDLMQALAPGSAALNPRGVARIELGSPVLACRLSEDHLLCLATTAGDGVAQALTGLCAGRPVLQTDVTSGLAGFCVLGPRLEECLCRLTHLDIRPTALPMDACAETALAGVEALLVRTADLAVPAMRVYVAWDFGEYVWERMLEEGRELQITPLGLDSLSSLASPDTQK